MYVKYFEAKQTQKINSVKQIIMTILINTYWLIITKVAGISLVAYVLSLNNKAIKTHRIDSRGRDGGQRHGKAGGHDGATDAVYHGFF